MCCASTKKVFTLVNVEIVSHDMKDKTQTYMSALKGSAVVDRRVNFSEQEISSSTAAYFTLSPRNSLHPAVRRGAHSQCP